MGDMRRNMLRNFIFSKTFLFDEPGIILNKNISRFGRENNFTRVVFLFGDLLIDLYKESIFQFGEERTFKLWKKIGKETGLRYVSFSGKKSFPKEIRLKVIEKVFNALKGAGLGDFELGELDGSLNFTVECKDSFFMKKMSENPFFEGLFSGVFSGVFSQNFDCNDYFLDGESRKFNVFISSEEEIFLDDVCCHSNYLSKNKYRKQNFLEKNYSLKDFFKFNEVFLDDEFNFWRIKNYPLFPSEVGLFGLIFKNYFEAGFGEIFKKVYVDASERIFLDLLGQKDFSQRIKYFKHFLSALGWGIADLKTSGDKIHLYVFSLPFCRYGPVDKAYFFNGLLNAVFRKKFSLLEVGSSFVYG